MPDKVEIVRHESMTAEQIMTHLPGIVFAKMKGRILNAVETYLDASDPRLKSLRNEICMHIADTSLFIARQIHKVAKEKGIDVDLSEYIERADMAGINVHQGKDRPR